MIDEINSNIRTNVSIPTQDQLLGPLLRYLAHHRDDPNIKNNTDVFKHVANKFALTQPERQQPVSSDPKKPLYENRCAFARNQLNIRGLILVDGSGVWKLSSAGRVLEHKNIHLTDEQLNEVIKTIKPSQSSKEEAAKLVIVENKETPTILINDALTPIVSQVEEKKPLWSISIIDASRVKQFELSTDDIVRTIIVFDPAVSNGTSGISIASLGRNGHVYIRDDASTELAEGELGDKDRRLIKKIVEHFDPESIFYESNNGGKWVASSIRGCVDRRMPIHPINASKDKMTRAEPVAAAFKERRVHLVGHHPELEKEMTTYAGKGKSPDRLDAMVHAVVELLKIV